MSLQPFSFSFLESFSSVGEGQSCLKESHKDFDPLMHDSCMLLVLLISGVGTCLSCLGLWMEPADKRRAARWRSEWSSSIDGDG